MLGKEGRAAGESAGASSGGGPGGERGKSGARTRGRGGDGCKLAPWKGKRQLLRGRVRWGSRGWLGDS